jgi:uncharacterized protein YtpQ (UPF0354 family)
MRCAVSVLCRQYEDTTGKRRTLLKFAGAALAASAGLYRAPGFAQNPQFRDADRTRDRIVALVRSSGDADPKGLLHIQKIEPIADVAIAGRAVRPELLPLMDYFVGDLHLRYSFDHPKYVSSVSAADLKRLKLGREELLPLSIANFRRRYEKFKVERLQPHLASVTDAGDLEPTLMLDASFWEAERERVGSEIVAAVPARDALVFTNRSVASNVDVLKAVVAEVYRSAAASALSNKLFLWNQGRWELFG